MDKKKRLFYLDFIRAVAVIVILLTHYNALYIYGNGEIALDRVILTSKIANLYIGDFGVSLFLIISGASLMYAYEKKLELKKFYIKRFLSIYPMFWTAYFISFMHSFWMARGIDQGIPKVNILLSLIGMDGYFSSVIPTFYKVGEWFLGFIIIMYILFPIIKYLIEKYPIITCIVIIAMYGIANCYYSFKLPKSIFILTRLPEIAFGMYFVKYIRKTTGWMALVAGTIIVVNSVQQPVFDKDIQTTYIGIAAFILLTYFCQWLSRIELLTKICNMISRYSYAIFLTHHYIIYTVALEFDLTSITILESYILFLFCCCCIFFFSYILYRANGKVISFLKCNIKFLDT